MKKILLFAAALVFALNMTAGNKAQQIGKNRQSIVALSSVAQNARVDKSAVKTTDLTIAKRTAGQKKTFVSVEQRLKDHKVMPVRRAAARVAEGTLVTNLVALPAGTDNFSFAWNAEGENIAGWLVSLLDANGKLIASASYAADDRWMFEEEGSWSYSATSLLQDAKSEEYNGVVGEAWDDNVETTTFEFWGMEFDQDILKEGAYSVKVQPLDADGNIIDEGATASVEVKAYDLSDLTLEAIENNTKLSINFNKPAELPEGAVIYVQVTSGAEVIMIENFESVELPLVVDIEDNKFYSVFAGIYSADDDELGEQVSGDITVGVNPIEPKNLKAEVKEHEVTLSWEVAGEAEAFYLFVYDANDEQIIAEQVAGTSVVKTLANGNYTWEVVAVSSDEQGAYAASEFIEGEAFVVDSKEAMVYDITFTNAQVADYGDVDGKRNFWLTMFNDNDDEPSVGFDLFAPVADKLSGDYTISDNSIGTEYSAWFKNDNDTEGTPFVEASVKIEFLGAEQTEDGVQGNFKITFEAKDADGNIYKGSFEGLALAYDHEEYANSYNVVFVEFTGEEGWPEPVEPATYDVTNLVLTLSEDGKQVTVTFDIPEDTPQNAIIYASIMRGATEISSSMAATSPIVFDVEEGYTYSVYVGIYDGTTYKLIGTSATNTITIGTNKLEPKDLKAEVDGNNVTLSWSAEEESQYYWITVIDENGNEVKSTYAEGTSKLIEGLAKGTYTWTVQAMELDGDGYLNASSDEILGEAFEIKDELEAQVIELSFDYVQAAYYEEYSEEGAYDFYIVLGNVSEDGSKLEGAGLTLDVYSTSATSLSGEYSFDKGNLGQTETQFFEDIQAESGITFVEASVKIEFLQPYEYQGAYYAVYRITFNGKDANGNEYKAVYENIVFTFDATTKADIDMSGEEGWPATGIEDATMNNGIDFNAPMYDVLGRKVGTDYRGIIVQKGHKYIVR
ncbi:MAG: hypothetical protein IJ756_01820 [Paludibacteraceae bacterium]|nr:hypothetical protein [Paludibacteraceae bacterium]